MVPTYVKDLSRLLGGSSHTAWEILLRPGVPAAAGDVCAKPAAKTLDTLLLSLYCVLGPKLAQALRVLVDVSVHPEVVRLLVLLARIDTNTPIAEPKLARALLYRRGLRQTSMAPSEFFPMSHCRMTPWQTPALSSLGEDLFVSQQPLHGQTVDRSAVASKPAVTTVTQCEAPLVAALSPSHDLVWRSTVQALVIRSVGHSTLLPDACARAYSFRFLRGVEPRAKCVDTPWGARCVLGLRAYADGATPSASSSCGALLTTFHDAAQAVSKLEHFVAWLLEQQPTHRALARALTIPGRGPLYHIKTAAIELRTDLSLVELDAKAAKLRTEIRRLFAFCRSLNTTTGSALLSSLYAHASQCPRWWPEFESACWPLVEGLKHWLTFGEIDPRVSDFLVETRRWDAADPAAIPWERLPAQPGWSSGVTLHLPNWIPRALLTQIRDTGLLLRFITVKPQNAPVHAALTWSDCSWEAWDTTLNARCPTDTFATQLSPPLALTFSCFAWEDDQSCARDSEEKKKRGDAALKTLEKKREKKEERETEKRQKEDSQRAEYAKKLEYRSILDEQVAKKLKARRAAQAALDAEDEERFLLDPTASKKDIDDAAEWLLERSRAEDEVDAEMRRLDWRLKRLTLDARRQDFEQNEMLIWDAHEVNPLWYLVPSTLANRVIAYSCTASFVRARGPLRVPEHWMNEATEKENNATLTERRRVAPDQDSSAYLRTLEVSDPSEAPRERPSAAAIGNSALMKHTLAWHATVPSPVRNGASSLNEITSPAASALRPNRTLDSSGVQAAWAAETKEPAMFLPVVEENTEDGSVANVEDGLEDFTMAARALVQNAYEVAIARGALSTAKVNTPVKETPTERWASRDIYRDISPTDVLLEERVIEPLRCHIEMMERKLWAQLCVQWDARGHLNTIWRVTLFMDGTAEDFVERLVSQWRLTPDASSSAWSSSLRFRVDVLFQMMPWNDPYVDQIRCACADNVESGSSTVKLLDTLSVDFVQQYPWGALISARALKMYNEIFRLLANVKVAHSDLRRIWIGIQTTRTTPSTLATRLCLLHHDLLHSITHFDLFLAQVVAQFKFCALSSLTQWQRWHDDQLEHCLDLCFLTSRGALILETFIEMLDIVSELRLACARPGALSLDTLEDLRLSFVYRRKTLRKVGTLTNWNPAQKQLLATI